MSEPNRMPWGLAVVRAVLGMAVVFSLLHAVLGGVGEHPVSLQTAQSQSVAWVVFAVALSGLAASWPRR